MLDNRLSVGSNHYVNSEFIASVRGNVVESNRAWKRVMEVEESRFGLFTYWLEGAVEWHEEWNLKAAKVPSPKEVGDSVIHHGKEYVVMAKRFDLFERKWKYILEPPEQLSAGRILSIQVGAAVGAPSTREDD